MQSLESIAAKRVAKEIEQNPALCFETLKDVANVPIVIDHLSPYAVRTWWKLYHDDTFGKFVNFWQLSRSIDLYEEAFLEKSKGITSEKQEDVSFSIPESFENALIDIYSKYDSFFLENQRNSEKEIEKLCFAKEIPFCPPTDSKERIHSVVPYGDFLERFGIFTNHQLSNWNDWNNMVVIGGSIVASLLPIPAKYSGTKESIAKYYHNIAYTQSDIDVYIYGLSTEEFRNKVLKLHEYLKKIHKEVLVVRTTFTLTFCTKYPNRHIQVVLGKWNNLEEVLYEPDVDCTCVAFDGKRVWSTYRAQISYNKRWIVASPTRYTVRHFPEYETRLIKYSKRGFYIVDEALIWKNISKYYLFNGKERILEHKVVRGRSGVAGLRLLLAGIKFPEVFQQVDIFQDIQWTDNGLSYGPEYDTNTLREKLKSPIMETNHYGPWETVNPYLVVNSIEEMQVHLHNLGNFNPEWRLEGDWYEFLLKENFEREELEILEKEKKSKKYREKHKKTNIFSEWKEQASMFDQTEIPPYTCVSQHPKVEVIKKKVIFKPIGDFERSGNEQGFLWENEIFKQENKMKIVEELAKPTQGFNRHYQKIPPSLQFSDLEKVINSKTLKEDFDWLVGQGFIYRSPLDDGYIPAPFVGQFVLDYVATNSMVFEILGSAEVPMTLFQIIHVKNMYRLENFVKKFLEMKSVEGKIKIEKKITENRKEEVYSLVKSI